MGDLKHKLNIFDFIFKYTKRYYFSKGEEYKNNRYTKKREECSDKEAIYITEQIIKHFEIKDISDLYEAEKEIERVLKETKDKYGEEAENIINSFPKTVHIKHSLCFVKEEDIYEIRRFRNAYTNKKFKWPSEYKKEEDVIDKTKISVIPKRIPRPRARIPESIK